MTKDEGLNPRRSPSGVGAGGAGVQIHPKNFRFVTNLGNKWKNWAKKRRHFL